MSSFDLTANINARLNVGNVRAIANQLRNQLSVTANVDVRLARNTAQGLSNLTGGLRTLNKELVNVATNSKSAEKALLALGNAFRNINGQLSANTKAQQNLQNISNQAKTAGTQMEQFGRQAGLAFRRFAGFRIASGFVTQFFSAVTKATKEAISFQRELVKISQVSGRSLQSLQSLTDEITRLSTSLGVSSSDLLNVSRILNQAGLSANQTQQALEALAKTTLAPTFTNIEQTTEGAIAIFKQFNISAKDLEKALGAINAVSGQFAVESDDIIAAVKRAGGVFAATSEGVSQGIDALNEFVAVFTSVRATTREGAETIATGLRTIFTRIQRPTTINFLKELGVNLTDLEGKFVGPFEAVNRISQVLQNLDTRDPQFARLVEELGGFRQVGKVIPLLTEQETRLKALQAAQQGYNSLSKDAATAQEAWSVQLQKVREEFVALIRGISNTGTFKTFLQLVIDLTRELIRMADSVKPILPILGALAVYRGASAGLQFGRGLLGKGGVRFHSGGYVGRQAYANGGDIRPRGLVPGGRGVRDDVRATLQEGEFVIRRQAVDTIGRQNLDKINRTGRMPFDAGGLVSQNVVGAALLKPMNAKSTNTISINQKEVPSLNKAKNYILKSEALDEMDSKIATKEIISGTIGGIKEGTRKLSGINLSETSSRNIFNTANPSGILGSMFEGILLAINSNGLFDQSSDPNRPFDFINGFNNTLGQKFQGLAGIKYIDAKVSSEAAQPRKIKPKIISQLNLEAQTQRVPKPEITKEKKGLTARELEAKAKRQAKMAAKLGFASGGSVPALLTRGEYVINRSSARSLGLGNLHALNNADRFNKGGLVGKRQRFLSGGQVLKVLSDIIANSSAYLGSTAGKIRRKTRPVFRGGLSGIPTRVGGLLGGQRGAGFGSKLSNNIPALGAGAFLLSSQLGGASGAGLSGAVGGAALGSSIGSIIPGGSIVGGAIGGIVGGIYSVLNQFAQSRLDEQIKKNSDTITASLGKLEDGMKKFSQSGNINDLINSLKVMDGVAQSIVDARLAQETGDSVSSNAERQKVRNELGKINYSDAFKDAFTSGALAAVVSGAGGGAIVGSALGLPGAIGGGIIGGGAALGSAIITPENFVSADSVRRAEFRKQSFNLSVGQDLKSQLSPAADAAETFIIENLKKGLNSADLINQLGGEAQVALATKYGGTQELKALGSANTEEERSRIARFQLQSQKFLIDTLPKRIALEKELAANLSNANIQLDKFDSNLTDVAALIDRAANAGENFVRRNDALLGTGIVSSAQTNVFDNPRAFSGNNLAYAANRVVGSLGGSPQSKLATDLFKGLAGLNDLQRRLPDVLANTPLVGGGENGEAQANAIEDNLRKGFSNIPESILNKLIADIRSNTQGANRQGVSVREFAQTKAEELAEQATKKLAEIGKKTVDVQNKAITEYEQAVGKWISLQQQANQTYDNSILKEIENRNQITALDRNLSFDELIEGYVTQQNRGALRSGAGGSDLGSIATRLNQIDAQRRSLEDESARFSNTGIGDPRSIANGFAQLRIQQDAAEEVLKQIATNTQITAAATQKLQEIENAKKTSQQLAEDFISGSPVDQFKFRQDIALAQASRQGQQFSGERASRALRGERLLTGLEGGTEQERDQRIRAQLAARGDVQNLFRLGGRTAQESLLIGNEEQNLRNILGRNLNVQRQAGDLLGTRSQDKADEFLFNANQRFEEIIGSLSNILKDFSDGLASIPDSVNVGGEIAVNVSITGDNTLLAFRQEFGAIVDQKIKQALNNHIDSTNRIENLANA